MKRMIAGVMVSLLLTGLVSAVGLGQAADPSSLRWMPIDGFGEVLVTTDGYPLYRFAEDSPGTSACTNGCAETWTAFHENPLHLGEGLDASLFGEIERDDGSRQTTYLGWPLYTFAGDTAPGEASGHGSEGLWFAVTRKDLLPLVAAWMNVELVDVLTGASFRVSDFYGRPVLIESFAVWCSVCLRQQKEMAKLVEREGEAIVHISLDTDPNEDADAVIGHANRHGFEWLFSVSPADLTRTLINEFGLTVVNAPRAPVILVEADGSARLLSNGVKTVDTLLEEIGEGSG